MKQFFYHHSLKTKVFFVLVGIVSILSFGLYSCQRDTSETRPTVKQSVDASTYTGEKSVYIQPLSLLKQGDIGWFDTKGAGVPVSFGGAAFYYLPNTLQDYDMYYTLIKDGKDVSTLSILKFEVAEQKISGMETIPGAFPLIKVEKPSESEISEALKLYGNEEESLENITSRSVSLKTTMSLKKARELPIQSYELCKYLSEPLFIFSICTGWMLR